jgi:hypothetical protein
MDITTPYPPKQFARTSVLLEHKTQSLQAVEFDDEVIALEREFFVVPRICSEAVVEQLTSNCISAFGKGESERAELLLEPTVFVKIRSCPWSFWILFKNALLKKGNVTNEFHCLEQVRYSAVFALRIETSVL